ncbi:MAG: hypothetical protein HYZ13_14090 [Acidobacteria bacterium]|nr:hypothetical protein [Acidobacteriota bacterium]
MLVADFPWRTRMSGMGGTIMKKAIRELFHFPSKEAAMRFLSDIKAKGYLVTNWAIAEDIGEPGVIIAVEVA